VLVAEQALGGEQGRVLGQVLPVHEQVLPVHVDLHVRHPARPERVDDVQAHPDVAHEDLHGRLGVLVLEEQLAPVRVQRPSRLLDAVEETRPRLGVGRLERVVVALDPGPHDQLGADLRRELDGVERDLQRVAPDEVVGRAQAALAEARVEVQAGRQAVDLVAVERGAHVVEVLGVELLRVVELVGVHEVAEARHRAADLLRGRLRAVHGLVAARHEAGDHPTQRPDAERGLQAIGHGAFLSAES
jgi:hypothetical protein